MTAYDHPDAPPRELDADEVIDHYNQQVPGLWQHLQNVTQQEGRRDGRAAELARLFTRHLQRPLREEEHARITLALTTQQEEAPRTPSSTAPRTPQPGWRRPRPRRRDPPEGVTSNPPGLDERPRSPP